MSVADPRPAGDLSAVLMPYLPLLGALRRGAAVDADRTSLVEAAAEIWSRPGFDIFLSRPSLGFEPFDYQWQTAQTVLRRMRGRAILADEVGLGKTIEAGLVLSELRMRGLGDRALVVVPAGLTEQWREELERKFALPATIAAPAEWDTGSHHPVVIVSLAAARREPLKAALTDQPWDVIIMDEAHRLRNPRSASGRLARTLSARYLLLLTATPVENRLQDLYELVSLVAPGLLGTPAQFRAQHGSGDPGAPRDISGLRARTREVMVRHRRSEVSLMLPQRLAETVLVTPTAAEAALYTQIASRIRQEARGAPQARRLTLRSLARLAGSSPAAVAPTLAKVGWADLARQAAAIGSPSKIAELVTRLRAAGSNSASSPGAGSPGAGSPSAGPNSAGPEKVLVFTAFRQTLELMAGELARQGIPAVAYHGSLARLDKEKAIGAFRDEVPVMLSTESAGEGRNLQFCHMMINVDLPWNPMQIEQRLGRLHRVGQTREVLLTNLVARGTIEQRIRSRRAADVRQAARAGHRSRPGGGQALAKSPCVARAPAHPALPGRLVADRRRSRAAGPAPAWRAGRGHPPDGRLPGGRGRDHPRRDRRPVRGHPRRDPRDHPAAASPAEADLGPTLVTRGRT